MDQARNAAGQAHAEARWRAIVQASPELADAVQLQQAIVAVLNEGVGIVGAQAPAVAMTRAALEQAQDESVPAFRSITCTIPAAALLPAFHRLCAILASSDGDHAARRISEAIASGRIDFASLLSSSLARREDAVRAAALQRDLAPDLLWLIAELTVSPYAHWLQDEMTRAGTPALNGRSWPHGYCPACGSWPALATDQPTHNSKLTTQDSVLTTDNVSESAGQSSGVVAAWSACCSFCAHRWLLDRRCPYCGDADAWGMIAPVDAAPHRRIAWCRACRGYLKVIAADGSMAFPMASIEDLATADLDRLAFEVGWGRPPLVQFPAGAGETEPCGG